MKNLLILTFLFVLCLTSCSHKQDEPDWETYTSNDHLYKIEYPMGWKVALNGHAFTITPTGDSGLVSVTGYVEPGTEFDETAFKTMVMADFSECRAREPFKPVKGENWDGEDGVYERYIDGQKVMYLFRVAHRGQVGVFIAISEMDIHLKKHLPNYKQIMDTLVLLDPPAEKYIGKYGVEPTEQKTETTNKSRPWQEMLVDLIRSTEQKKP